VTGLALVPGRLAVARLGPGDPVPAWGGAFTAAIRTPAELTIVADQGSVPPGVRAERDFRALAVDGPLPFTTVGLLARLTGALAAAGVSVFVVSTFDTDWILVRAWDLAVAVAALRSAGCAVRGFPDRPALLLDLLDTLVADPIHDEIPRFLGEGAAAYFAGKDPDAWVAFELGKLDHAGFCARMYADRRPIDPAGLDAAIRRGWALLPGMDALLDRLGGRDVHVLSNYPAWWRLVVEKHGFEGRIDRWFVSCETGVRKPDPEAYLGAARADKERNVRAARAVGMTAFVFRGSDALVADLRRVRILGGPDEGDPR
jgi:FMN hydrolase / 5-amino-6-(5-phospho-D-ribitylamino)uracil phosphatase